MPKAHERKRNGGVAAPLSAFLPSKGSWDRLSRMEESRHRSAVWEGKLQTLLASMEQSIASRCQVGVSPDMSLASSDTAPPPPWDAPVAAAEHAWAERSESAESDLLFLSASSLASLLSGSIADSRIGCNDEDERVSNSTVSSVVTL